MMHMCLASNVEERLFAILCKFLFQRTSVAFVLLVPSEEERAWIIVMDNPSGV